MTALTVLATCYLATLPSVATAAAGLSFTDQTLAGATAGQYYSGQIQASGGNPPYTFAQSDGTVPPGLSLSSSGVVSGTPDAPQVDKPVTSRFEVSLRDSSSMSPVYAWVEITVTPADYQPPPPLHITTTSVPNPQVSHSYSFTMQASGGSPPYHWEGTGFPLGFSMDSSGTITGSSDQEEQSTVTVDVSDASGEALNANQFVPPQAVETSFTFTVSSGITAIDPPLILAWDVIDLLPQAPDIIDGLISDLPGGGVAGTVGYVVGQVCNLTGGLVTKSCLG